MSHVPDDQPSPGDTADDTTAEFDAVEHDAVDLDAVEHDLNAVEVALNRLADGTYWTDEVTGQPIPDDVLVDNPLARRA